MRLAQVSVLLILACSPSYWRASELGNGEWALVGCYDLSFGTWTDSMPGRVASIGSGAPTRLRVVLDTLVWKHRPHQRRLLLTDTAPSRQPYAYWLVPSSDSVRIRIGQGVEGQGIELTLSRTRDSLVGTALESRWPFSTRRATAVGARMSC